MARIYPRADERGLDRGAVDGGRRGSRSRHSEVPPAQLPVHSDGLPGRGFLSQDMAQAQPAGPGGGVRRDDGSVFERAHRDDVRGHGHAPGVLHSHRHRPTRRHQHGAVVGRHPAVDDVRAGARHGHDVAVVQAADGIARHPAHKGPLPAAPGVRRRGHGGRAVRRGGGRGA